jgi:hypothetical protein
MRKTLLAFITAIALIFGAPLAATAATNDNTYRTLAAKWWTWALTQPAPTNPLLDETGAQCANQQSGNVWYLGGTFNSSGVANRSCTIPANTAVFFPVVNVVDVEYASDNKTVGYVRSLTAFVSDGASNLYVNLDGKALPSSAIVFERSDVFSFYLPDNNVFGIPAGYMSPCADSGYYTLLSKLSPGPHVLKFGGTLTFPDGTVFSTAATYNLTVSN